MPEHRTDEGNQALAGAMAYIEAGYFVGPVTISLRPDGKKDARFHTDWVKDPHGITDDVDQARAWAAQWPGCSWHAPCGPNEIVVVEGDVKGNESGVWNWRQAKGPVSPMKVTTRSGGEHWYFRAPEIDDPDGPIRNSAGRVPGIHAVDVRGDGGTVFIAGSVVLGGGGHYHAEAILGRDRLPELSPHWARRLREAGRTERKEAPAIDDEPQIHERGWLDRRAREALDDIASGEQGGFRERLFTAAVLGFRAVDAGLMAREEVLTCCHQAIKLTWNHDANEDDVDWLRDAWRESQRTPWAIVDDGELPAPETDEPGEETDTEASEENPLPPPSWAPIDLGPHLDGTHTTPEASYLQRADGVALFYAGLVHWVYGESESGKSWVCLIAAARVLMDTGRVLFVDYESDPGAIVGRLRALGVPTDAIAAGLTYVRPETSCRREPVAFKELLEQSYDVAVVDGVTIGLGLEGGATNDTDDVSGWTRRIPLRIARATGAAVACVDHVTKDKDGRGRFPVGSQAKLAAIDGAGFLVEPTSAIRPGAVGEIVMRVAKDRPGGVRAHAGEWRQGDRTQEAARITLDATDPAALTVTVVGPEVKPGGSEGGGGKFTPTFYMERVSRFLSTTEGEVSTKAIETEVDGRADMIRKALGELALLGYVSRRQGPRNAVLYSHVKRYTDLVREANDEVLSDDDD